MNFYSVNVRKSLSVIFILGASLVLSAKASTLNELDDGEFVEMKPPLESAVDYYDKFYTSFNRFTRDVPLLHFRRNYATEQDNEESQEIESHREKRAVKFVDNDSPSSTSTQSGSPSSGKRDHFEAENHATTLAFGPASLTVNTGNAKHYPILGGGGYYPGGGGYYPGGGYLGGGYPNGGGFGGYPHGGGGFGGAQATATATAGGAGYGGYPQGGGYYPGGGYGGYGGYPGGGYGGGYFGGYPGGGYGGGLPGFGGGGLYPGGYGYGPYGYGRNGNSKTEAESDDTPLKRGSDKPSASSKSPASSGSSAVKFSSN